MKFIDLGLNLVLVVCAAISASYLSLNFAGDGLFTVLPDTISQFFLGQPNLQWVTLAVLVIAVVAKETLVKERRKA